MATDLDGFVDGQAGDTPANVLIGAVVGFLAAMLMPVLGQLLGGGVAGYLQQDDAVTSALVGGTAAVLSSVPWLVLFGLFVLPIVLGPMFAGVNEVTAMMTGLSLLVVLAVALVVVVPLGVVGVVGGLIGHWLVDT